MACYLLDGSRVNKATDKKNIKSALKKFDEHPQLFNKIIDFHHDLATYLGNGGFKILDMQLLPLYKKLSLITKPGSACPRGIFGRAVRGPAAAGPSRSSVATVLDITNIRDAATLFWLRDPDER